MELRLAPTKVWEVRKEMFYLMTHSTHFIYGYMASDMVKDHSDGLLFPISRKGSFFLHTRVGDSRCVSKWYTTYVGDRFSEVMTQ